MKLVPPISARLLDEAPAFPGEAAPTVAQLAGLRYERRVVSALEKLYEQVIPGPWIAYRSRQKSGLCQPDALVWLDNSRLLLVEVKLSWQRTARQKLMDLYGPLVQEIYKPDEISYVQIYKNWKRGAHKKPLNFYELDANFKKGKYKECHLP